MRVLAHAPVDAPPRVRRRRTCPPSLSMVPVLPAEVGRAAHQVGHGVHQRLQRLPRGVARGEPRPGGEIRQRSVPTVGELPASHCSNARTVRADRAAARRACHSPCARRPPRARPLACASSASAGTKNGGSSGQPRIGLRRRDLGLAQRRAVRLGGVALGGGGVGDDGAEDDQGGPIGLLRRGRCSAASIASRSFPSSTRSDVPAVGLEAAGHVLGEGERRCAVDGDVVVVVDDGELAEPEMTGERRRLAGDALHQVAVAGEDPGPVIHDLVPGRLNCAASSRSAIAMPTALPKPWPSGPVVVSTPGGVAALGMSRRLASPTGGRRGCRRARGRSRRGAAARRAASRRGRRRARSGRGRASPVPRDRVAGGGSRARRRPGPAPSACPDARTGLLDRVHREHPDALMLSQAASVISDELG